MKFDLTKPYMTEPERSEFARLQSAGLVTIFNVHPCKECGAEIPLIKRYCSRKEWEARIEKLKDVIREAVRTQDEKKVNRKWARRKNTR